MNNQDDNVNRDNLEDITYVYIPDEDVHGFIIKEGAFASTIQYFDRGVGYIIEIPNDEFIVVNKIGVGYLEEKDENL